MSPRDSFSPDYPVARQRFRSEAAARGWALESLPVETPDAASGELTIDTASLGPADAENLLIVSSGLHGTEALFGSAVQLAWLATLPSGWQPPMGWRVLLQHVLNPWGAARLRRFDEGNVDLNRNFLEPGDFDRLRHESERSPYRQLDPTINPPTPPGRFDLFPLQAVWMIARFGMGTLRQVIPVGQYAFPKGLFFGGNDVARTTRLVMDQAPHWVGAARNVIHLDFHTGLGKWGTYRLLSAEPHDSPRLGQASVRFGGGLVEPHGGPTAYHSHGDMGIWLRQRFADRDYLFLTAEFGTYGPVSVIGALRAENRAHHWASPSSQAFRRAKERVREAFVPRSRQWRQTVVREAVRLIQRAMPDEPPAHPW